jgi:hypothetical protein
MIIKLQILIINPNLVAEILFREYLDKGNKKIDTIKKSITKKLIFNIIVKWLFAPI